MNTDQFVKRVRETTQLPTNSEDWTAREILREASQCILERFTQPVLATRSGYWLQTYTFSTTAGVPYYRIPPRAVVQGLELFAMQPPGAALNTTSWYQLSVLTNSSAMDFQGTQGGSNPRWFSFEGDSIVLYPTPAVSQTLQMKFYLRPPYLIPVPGDTFGPIVTGAEDPNLDYPVPTTGVLNSAVYNPTNTVFTVQYDANYPLFAVGDKIDLVNLDGTSEAVALDMTITAVGVPAATVAVTVSTAFTVAEQTKQRAQTQALVTAGTAWTIPLPIEMHSAAVAYTSAVVLMDKGDIEKATQVISRSEASVKKIVDMMQPRVKDRPYEFKTRNTFLRRRAGWRGIW